MPWIDWDRCIRALVLVHIGQQLGTDSKLARLVFDACEIAASIWR